MLAHLEALLRGDFVGFTADDRLKKHVKMMDYTPIGERATGSHATRKGRESRVGKSLVGPRQ